MAQNRRICRENGHPSGLPHGPSYSPGAYKGRLSSDLEEYCDFNPRRGLAYTNLMSRGNPRRCGYLGGKLHLQPYRYGWFYCVVCSPARV